ncbi:helix-turn-helix domain-containing protein, partial [Bradyrhizobium sp.]
MSRIRPLQRRSAPPQDQRQDSFRVAGEAVPDRFLSELGARVRTMRAVRGMSRKVLAQTSGVSERYIAQLESGQGNVSIMLLRRLAEVAGVQLEDLVADPAGRPKDWVLIRELLMQAPPVVIDDVKALLTGRPLDRPTQAANIQV